MMMDNKIQMETIFGDGSEQNQESLALNAGKEYLQATYS
jgi:hypothetical protein